MADHLGNRRRSAATGQVRVGISGWRYDGWRGHFYPAGLPQRAELAFASRVLSTVELNGSFYSLQRPEHYHLWHAQTPDDFLFSVKGPRYVTHMLKLRNARTAIANFLASGVLALDAKLGPILWQLPPQLPYDAERLDAFLALLPTDTEAALGLAEEHDDRLKGRSWLGPVRRRPMRHALEIRHQTYVNAEFIDLLRRYRVAPVVADTAGRWPWIEDLTTDFVYIRLHGAEELYVSGYDDGAIAHWAQRIDAWRHGEQIADARLASTRAASRSRHRDVFCYFDNDAKVHAPFDAHRLSVCLEGGVLSSPWPPAEVDTGERGPTKNGRNP